jgi:hypothetical protein
MTDFNTTYYSFGTVFNLTTNRTFPTRQRYIRFDASGEIRIPLYVIIFLLSVVGNILVILTIRKGSKSQAIK